MRQNVKLNFIRRQTACGRRTGYVLLVQIIPTVLGGCSIARQCVRQEHTRRLHAQTEQIECVCHANLEHFKRGLVLLVASCAKQGHIRLERASPNAPFVCLECINRWLDLRHAFRAEWECFRHCRACQAVARALLGRTLCTAALFCVTHAVPHALLLRMKRRHARTHQIGCAPPVL